MKTQVNTLETTIAAIVPQVMRAPQAIANDFTFGNNGAVTLAKGAKVTLDELASFAAENLKAAESAMVRTAGILRVARDMKEITIGEGDDKKSVPAFEYVKARFRALAPTDGAFYNALQMVAAIDVVETNKLPVSPFVVKESMGVLRKFGGLPKKDGEPLKLTNGEGGKLKAIVAKLKSGEAKVNSIREDVAKLSGKKKGAKKGGKKEEEKNLATEYTPERLGRDIKTVIGVWEKTVAAHGVEKARNKENVEAVKALALLAGLK